VARAAFCSAESDHRAAEAGFCNQQKQIEALTAGLQKVSTQWALNKPTQQTVLNSQ